MAIYFYKELTRNLEIGNTLPKLYQIPGIRNTKFTMDVVMKCYLLGKNSRATAFNISELLRKNQQMRWIKLSKPRHPGKGQKAKDHLEA